VQHNKKEIEMNELLAILSDVFFWGSLPLFIGAEVIQSHLEMTSFDQTLLQVVLALVVVVWALFWLNQGEISRLRIQIALKETMEKGTHKEEAISSQDEISMFNNPPFTSRMTIADQDCESNQRRYVTTH
jgi:hypothetical protein